MPVKNMIANAILSFRNMCVVLRNEKKNLDTSAVLYNVVHFCFAQRQL